MTFQFGFVKAKNELYESEQDQNDVIKDIFHTDPKEIIEALTIAKSYVKGLERPRELKIEPPYVKSLLVDFDYLGYCTSISLEALKQYLIEKGEMSSDESDSSFVSTIFLKVGISS